MKFPFGKKEEKLFKYETHIHCKLCSACSVVSPEEIVKAYAKAGYSGIVLTDHFIHGNSSVPANLPWEDRVRAYYNAVLIGREADKKYDLDVLFGLEHYYGHGGKEALLYGLTLDFVLENEPLFARDKIEELCKAVQDFGGFVTQAHPYRDRSYITLDAPDISKLADGIEVFNACNYPNENEQALALAKRLGKRMMSGADDHFAKLAGKAGMAFPHRLRTTQELACALRVGEGFPIVDGKISDSTEIYL